MNDFNPEEIMKKQCVTVDKVEIWTEYYEDPEPYWSTKKNLYCTPKRCNVQAGRRFFPQRPRAPPGKTYAFCVVTPDEVRRAARKEAWEVARKIAVSNALGSDSYSTDDLVEMFGDGYGPRILRDISAEEAIAKVKAWEKKKNEPKEMTVTEIEKALGHKVKIVGDK